MAGVADEMRHVDADQRHRLVVLEVDILVEHDFRVGGSMQPAIVLNFGLELTRTPARITQGQHRLVRPVTLGHGL